MISQKNNTIIAMYAISNDKNTCVKADFFEKLNETITNTGSSWKIILMKDFNGRMDSKKNNQAVRPFGENIVNNNGERLIYICEYNDLKYRMVSINTKTSTD